MNSVQEKSEQRSRDRTKARHQDLQARLLDVAEAAIVANGLDGLKARAIAEQAGCSVGAIYGVFADLDALVLAVNGRTLDEIGAVLAQVSDEAGPAEHLVRLAEAYLAYAAAHRQRWRALFQHRLPEGRALEAAFLAREHAAFAVVETPLAALRPQLPGAERAVLARTLFSAVHGMVDLGLDEKVASLTPAELREQIRLVVAAIAAGLSSV